MKNLIKKIITYNILEITTNTQICRVMMDLLDEMSTEKTTLWKEKDGQFYFHQITTKSNVYFVTVECKIKEQKK